MPSKTPKQVFPSYTQISTSIKKTQETPYQTRLTHLNKRIETLKANLNYDKQHRQLTKKLINEYKKQKMFEKPVHEELADLAVVRDGKRFKFADSLNQYLDDSGEEENNYEAHLRFRKKALERELQYEIDKSVIEEAKSIRVKDHNDEEEEFYKNLYKGEGCKQHKQGTARNDQPKQIQSRCAHLAENKKKLTELYLPYVQALAETNIVKWRVLN